MIRLKNKYLSWKTHGAAAPHSNLLGISSASEGHLVKPLI